MGFVGRFSTLHVRVALLAALLSPLFLAGGVAATVSGRGSFLPLQDRTGDPEIALRVETALRAELGRYRELGDDPALRDILRRLRMRDVASEPPHRLDRLAAELESSWFFSATLHEARDEPIPVIVVSAKLFAVGSSDLEWAGFESRTGLDGEKLLGLGKVETLADLIPIAAEGLVSTLAEEDRSGQPLASRGELSTDGPRGNARRSGRAAIVPFGSVTENSPTEAAELVGDALLAALHDRGFRLLVPGRLAEILAENGGIMYGAVSREGWESLEKEKAADWVVTGTVETYSAGGGQRPTPRVALSFRMLDSRSGRLRWIGGRDLTGRDVGGLFDRGRVFSAGKLAREIVDSLLEEATEALAVQEGDQKR